MFVFKHHLGVYLIVLMVITFFTWCGYSSDDPEVRELVESVTPRDTVKASIVVFLFIETFAWVVYLCFIY